MAILLLSGCSSFSINVEDLIEPPILSKEQAEITEELKKILNTSELKLKYPKYGEIHSPIIFENLDDDEEKEVIVFYEDTLDNRGSTRINIMDKTEGKWESIYDVPGESETIEFVSLANITDKIKKDLVVGWGTSEKRQKYLLNVYSYRDYTLKNLLSERYDSAMVIPSTDNKTMSQIVLLNYTSKTTAKLITPVSKNRLGVVGMAKLNSDVQSLLNITSYSDNGGYIFLDFKQKDGTVSTEVLKYTENDIVNLMSEDGKVNNFFYEAIRKEEIFCQDVNNDGMPDIPVQRLLPGYGENDIDEEVTEEKEELYLTEFYSINKDEAVKVQTSVINLSQGYKIIFPDKWQKDKVSVKKQPDREEFDFVKYNENYDGSKEVLLKIHLYAKDDYKDVFELQQFKLIAEKGNFEYYAYIPNNVDAELKITFDELEKMFKLLK